MTGIIISRRNLENNYKVISQEGKYKLTVAGNPAKGRWVNPNLAKASETYSHSYLVSFKAVEQRNIQRVLEAFGDEDAVDLAELNGLNIVHEIIVNANPETGEVTEPQLPVSGEVVVVSFQKAINKEGELVKDQNDKVILNSKTIQLLAPEVAPSFSFNSVPLMEADEEAETATETSKKKDKVPA